MDLGVLFPRLERLFVGNHLYHPYIRINTDRLEMLVACNVDIAGRVTRIDTLVCLSGAFAPVTREIGLCVVHDKELPLRTKVKMSIDCLVTLHHKLSNPAGHWNTLVTCSHRLFIPIDMRPSSQRSTRLVVMRINRMLRRRSSVVLHCEDSVLILDTGPHTVISNLNLRGVWKVVFLGVNTPPSVPMGVHFTTDETDPHLRRYRELKERFSPFEKYYL